MTTATPSLGTEQEHEYEYTCNDCGTGTDAAGEDVYGQHICSDCAARYHASCDDCGRIAQYWSELADAYNGGSICRSCAEGGWWSCDGCGILLSDRCNYGDCCLTCAEDEYDNDTEDRIHDYGYRPVFLYYGTGPVYLGFELELETRYGQGLPDIIDTVEDHLYDVAYLKEDSSLNYGVELVTHPLSPEWVRNNFPWHVLERLADCGAMAGDDAPSAGLHVHVDRRSFDGPCHVYRWLKLIYRNEAGVSAIARRRSGQWAAFRAEERVNAKEHAKGDRYGYRYSAVNCQNSETFEVRVFASTLHETELRAALDLVAASVEYTRTLSVGDIVHRSGWSWETFIDWVSQRPEYTALARMAGVLCAC